jgi:ATP-dependent protease ClpP protease subunit
MPYQSEPESLAATRYDPVAERLLRARTIVISGEITRGLAATSRGSCSRSRPIPTRASRSSSWLGAEAAVRYGLVGRIVERSLDIDA